MAGSVSFSWDKGSVNRVVGNINQAAVGANKACGRAIYAEAEHVLERTIPRVPVATGRLRDSGKVDGPRMRAGDVEATVIFGNETDVDYAIFVHEDLRAVHPRGEAKFLERTLNEAKATYSQRVGQRISDFFGGMGGIR